MKTIYRLSFTFCIIFLPLITTAQNASESSKAEAINQIFNEIPIEAKLAETPENLHSLLSQNPFGLQASQNEQMLGVFEDYFMAPDLSDQAKKVFQQNYEPESVQTVLNRFGTENFQTVLAAEKEFYTLQGIRKRVVNQYEMEQDPPSQKRIELINELSQAMSAVETEVESQVIIFRAAVTAFSELNSQQSLTNTQIEGAVNNYRYQVQSEIDQEITNQLLMIFYGLDDDKLEEQISFYKTTPGTWLRNTTSDAVHSTYQTASDDFLDAIKKL